MCSVNRMWEIFQYGEKTQLTVILDCSGKMGLQANMLGHEKTVMESDGKVKAFSEKQHQT